MDSRMAMTADCRDLEVSVGVEIVTREKLIDLSANGMQGEVSRSH